MKNRKSIVAASLVIILAGCVGLAVQQSNAQRVRPAMDDQYISHYEGQGEGLLALDDNGTLWAIYEIAGRAEPTYRVMAIAIEDRSRPAALPEVGRALPRRGNIIVNIDPEHEALEVKMPGTRISFVAAMNERSVRAIAGTPILDASSFAAATMEAKALNEILKQTDGLTLEVVGDDWPLVLLASHAFRGELGLSSGSGDRADTCCNQKIECITGGEGSSSCNLTLGGISVGTTCDGGFHACCCNIGGIGEITLRANCCED